MTNMRDHMTGFHPEKKEEHLVIVTANQGTIEQTASNSVLTFTAKSLRPYSVTDKEGFCTMLPTGSSDPDTLQPEQNLH